MASLILVCLPFSRPRHALGNPSARQECGKFHVSGEPRFRGSSRRDNSQCFPDRPPRPESSGLASVLALFSRDQIFHPRPDLTIPQQFTAIDLREAFFALTAEPFVG